jgi:hypothetical protein
MASGEDRTLIVRDASGQFYVVPGPVLEAGRAGPELQAALAAYVAEHEVTGAGLGLASGVPGMASAAGLQGADVEALAFIVMIDAAQAAQSDLQSIMAGVQAMTAQKQALRATLGRFPP